MLKNRVINSSAAIFATIAMGANAAMPSFAEGKTYAGQTGGASVVLEKYLIMDQEANVPNVSFAYSIAPGAAQDASAGNSKVFAGNDASAVTGAPTIAGVTFAVGDTTYTSVQDLPASVNSFCCFSITFYWNLRKPIFMAVSISKSTPTVLLS